MQSLTHIRDGVPTMVDVSGKQPSRRMARAEASVLLPREVREKFEGNDIHSPKGPVFQTAILAGIMAAKRTGDLIPLCHPLSLDDCKIAIALKGDRAHVECEVLTTSRTGVEMEALLGASVAALTLYDMCKAISPEIVIEKIQLLEKTGGKRDFRRVE